MKAKRIAEITANIVVLTKQVEILSEELRKEHGNERAASMIARAIIARETAKIAMLKYELSAVIQTSVKKNSEQLQELLIRGITDDDYNRMTINQLEQLKRIKL